MEEKDLSSLAKGLELIEHDRSINEKGVNIYKQQLIERLPNNKNEILKINKTEPTKLQKFIKYFKDLL